MELCGQCLEKCRNWVKRRGDWADVCRDGVKLHGEFVEVFGVCV